jgi:hypothetical protein
VARSRGWPPVCSSCWPSTASGTASRRVSG